MLRAGLSRASRRNHPGGSLRVDALGTDAPQGGTTLSAPSASSDPSPSVPPTSTVTAAGSRWAAAPVPLVSNPERLRGRLTRTELTGEDYPLPGSRRDCVYSETWAYLVVGVHH